MLCKKATTFVLGLVGAGCLSILAEPVHAGTLSGGVYYSFDSLNDSVSGNNVGGTKYEINALAIKETANEVMFFFTGNLPLSGTSSNFANDGYIAWGDIILNNTGKTLDAASNASELYTIHFVQNESGVQQLGLIKNAKAKSVASQNGLLLSNLQSYNNWVSKNGGTPSIGDFSAGDPYFNLNHHVQNVTESGTWIGGVNVITDTSGLGIDFNQFGVLGTNTFGVSVSRDLLPAGSWYLHLGPECDNDLIGAKFTLAEKVPEPSTVLPLGLLGAMFALSKIKRTRFQIG